jgi:ethanolamine utilization protein EutA (predicted chaperonin)
MSNTALQQLLIDKIKKIEDASLLQEAGRLFDVDVEDSTVYVLSPSERADIEEARQQIKNGESFTHEQANQLVSEWLKK